MIEAKDLRIGNWVTEESRINGEILQEANPVQVDVKLLYDLVTNNTGTYRYESIPLTADILLKCGFEKIEEGSMAYPEIWRVKYRQVLVMCVFDLQHRNEGEYSWIEGNTIIHNYYLHDLQNLYYSHTKEELEYKP